MSSSSNSGNFAKLLDNHFHGGNTNLKHVESAAQTIRYKLPGIPYELIDCCQERAIENITAGNKSKCIILFL